mmetsp:Transcript_41790/g.97301  ORF Transcript_41790/g.97301 Transcript_41790/m.97301 type:complete len:209 (-) Transcript_41790:2595-3221(-)
MLLQSPLVRFSHIQNHLVSPVRLVQIPCMRCSALHRPVDVLHEIGRGSLHEFVDDLFPILKIGDDAPHSAGGVSVFDVLLQHFLDLSKAVPELQERVASNLVLHVRFFLIATGEILQQVLQGFERKLSGAVRLLNDWPFEVILLRELEGLDQGTSFASRLSLTSLCGQSARNRGLRLAAKDWFIPRTAVKLQEPGRRLHVVPFPMLPR